MTEYFYLTLGNGCILIGAETARQYFAKAYPFCPTSYTPEMFFEGTRGISLVALGILFFRTLETYP